MFWLMQRKTQENDVWSNLHYSVSIGQGFFMFVIFNIFRISFVMFIRVPVWYS